MPKTKRLPELHPGQVEVVKSDARFKVLSWGRRAGKSLLLSVVATKAGADGKRVWVVSPIYKMAEEILVYCKQLCRQLPRVTVQERVVRFPGGGSIEVRSADDPDRLRGSGLDLLLIDEAGMMSDQLWTTVLRPALADRRGKAVIASTPRGVGTWFHGAFMLGQDPEQPEWKSWKMPTTGNPYISKAEIEAARTAPGMTDRIFAQEYLGDFLDHEGVVFRRVIESSTGDPKPGGRGGYAGFIDLAETTDATAVAIFYWDHGTNRAVQVHCDRWFRTDWAVTLERLRAKIRAYPGRWGMDTSGQLHASRFIDDLRQGGGYVEAIRFDHQFKLKVVQNAISMLERNQAVLLRADSSPEAEVQQGELLAFTARTGPGGFVRYEAPPGMHDDMAIACITAMWMCRRDYGEPVDTSQARRALDALWS